MAPPLLGFVRRQDRNIDQQNAHAAAENSMPQFMVSGPPVTLNKGEKVILSGLWKDPDVVADLGFTFERFHQLTGSCVGASLGNALVTLMAVQRKLAVNPTKVVLPFWPFDYGRTRWNEGDRGQGEGAINSVACQTMKTEGVLDATEAGLPQFTNSDGLILTENLEMQYSDGGAAINTKWLPVAKQYPLGTAAPVKSSQDFYQGIVNGYPGYFGCDDFVSKGHIVGSGSDAYVSGTFDGRGGHSTCILGVWEHPTDGPLYLYQNNWPKSTYPDDPAGGSPCSVWLKESQVDRIFSQLDGDAYVLSHLTWFPSQSDQILNWIP